MGWNHQLDNFKPATLWRQNYNIAWRIFNCQLSTHLCHIIHVYLPTLSIQIKPNVSKCTIPPAYSRLGPHRAQGKLPRRWQSSSTRSTSQREDVPWNGRVTSGLLTPTLPGGSFKYWKGTNLMVFPGWVFPNFTTVVWKRMGNRKAMSCNVNQVLGGGFQYFFIFIPILGKIPILTTIFPMGWNHRLVDNYSNYSWCVEGSKGATNRFRPADLS